jgi:hypothetical protein
MAFRTSGIIRVELRIGKMVGIPLKASGRERSFAAMTNDKRQMTEDISGPLGLSQMIPRLAHMRRSRALDRPHGDEAFVLCQS